MKNNYEAIYFSKAAGTLPATLVKINSFTSIFHLFSNIYTSIRLAELISLTTPKVIIYISTKNYRRSYQKVFFIFGFELTCEKKYYYLTKHYCPKKQNSLFKKILSKEKKLKI